MVRRLIRLLIESKAAREDGEQAYSVLDELENELAKLIEDAG